MNVFNYELRSYRKNMVIWSVSIILLLVASMAKFSTLTSEGMDIKLLLDQFPATVQAVFGMNGLDMTTIVGYFGVLYLYVAVMLSIQAGLLGADVIDKEEQDKTTEFLYVKPRSRARILTAKLAAALVVIVVTNLVTFVASCLLAAQYVALDTVLRELVLYNVGYMVLQLLFMALGAVLAASSLRPKLAGRLVATGVFGAYLLHVVVTIEPALHAVGSISPLVQLQATAIIANGSLDWWWVGGYVITAAVCVALTYYYYARRDLRI